jgi:hypothetical protein
MTPKKLLADLMRQGFRLAVCGNNIEVAPINQLTESVRQDIRKHKGELMALLRAEGPLDGQVLAPGKDRQKAPKSEVSASMPVGIQAARSSAMQDSTRHALAPEPITAPARPSEPIQKRKRLAPLLCPSCRQLGYAHCRNCMLATDSSLALDGDVLTLAKLPTAQDRWPWHRCKRCDNCFKAPQFPALNLCPDCVAKGAP